MSRREEEYYRLENELHSTEGRLTKKRYELQEHMADYDGVLAAVDLRKKQAFTGMIFGAAVIFISCILFAVGSGEMNIQTMAGSFLIVVGASGLILFGILVFIYYITVYLQCKGNQIGGLFSKVVDVFSRKISPRDRMNLYTSRIKETGEEIEVLVQRQRKLKEEIEALRVYAEEAAEGEKK